MSEEMILFGAALATLSIAAIGFILAPLVRRPAAQGISARNLDVALYREQRAEVDAALAEERITLEQARQAGRELDLRLLDDTGQEPDSEVRWLDRGPAWLAGLLLSAAVAGGAAWLYLDIGSWRFIETRAMDAEELVERLAREMQQRPDALQGWTLLGGAYRRMGRYPEAAAAYSELNSRSPQAETLVAEAEMWAMSNEGIWEGRPNELIQQALALDPNNGPALWYSGQAAFAGSDWLQALRHWERLARLDLPAEFREVVSGRINEALSQYQMQPDALIIPVSVSLAEKFSNEFQQGIPEQAALFVLARSGDPDAGGMPLAVARLPITAFPVSLSLHDGKAMFAERPLSAADAWTVVARISMSGDAIAQPGDLEGMMSLTTDDLENSGGEPVQVVIDRRRE